MDFVTDSMEMEVMKDLDFEDGKLIWWLEIWKGILPQSGPLHDKYYFYIFIWVINTKGKALSFIG